MRISTMRFLDSRVGPPLCFLLTLLRRLLPERGLGAPPQAILLIKFWGMGSLICAAPLARALRARHPQARLDVLTFPSQRETVELLGIADRVLTIEAGLRLAEFGGQEPYREPVAWLRCFKGIDTVTELHDFRRFHSARQRMAYVGLVPSECSSGERERRGAITKTGNRHVRRLLVEAAWHHRHRPALSGPLRARRQGQPARVLAIADRAQERLCARYRRMNEAGKILPKTIVAMARELTAYLWAVLHPAAAPMRS